MRGFKSLFRNVFDLSLEMLLMNVVFSYTFLKGGCFYMIMDCTRWHDVIWH